MRGDTAPGTNSKFDHFDPPSLSDSRVVITHAYLSPAPAEAIYLGPTAPQQLIAATGSAAPGIAGAQFVSFSNPSFSANSAFAFSASTTAGPGVWTGDANHLQLVAKSGDTPTGSSGIFQTFDPPAIGKSGAVTFIAHFLGIVPDEAIFVGTPDHVRQIVRYGDQAPGDPAGVRFTSFASTITPEINSHDWVAFMATVSGPGITAANDTGIWVSDQNGHLIKVVQEGDTVETRPGYFPTVLSIHPELSRFTDSGLLAFVVDLPPDPNGYDSFVGTSAILIASVPEPGMILPVVIMFAIAAMRRK